jgi:hypothetical protein
MTPLVGIKKQELQMNREMLKRAGIFLYLLYVIMVTMKYIDDGMLFSEYFFTAYLPLILFLGVKWIFSAKSAGGLDNSGLDKK